MSTLIEVGYNFQSDNHNFNGKLQGWAQCFSTSACMFISRWAPQYTSSDEYVRQHVQKIESQVGGSSWLNKILLKYPKISRESYTSLYWDIQKEAIQDALAPYLVKVAFEYSSSWDTVSRALKRQSPVILGTKLPPTKGHIILIVGEDEANWICHDPYGNARNGYVQDGVSGKYVKYNKKWLSNYVEGSLGTGTICVIYGINGP